MLKLTDTYSELLTDEQKEFFPKYEEGLENLKSKLVKRLERSYELDIRNPEHLHNLFVVSAQCLLRRYLCLFSSFALLWEKEDLISASIIGRSLYETVSALCYLNNKLEKAIASGSYISAYKLIASFSSNTRIEEFTKKRPADESLKNINVLEMLRELKKELPEIMEEYEWLSEFTHPNSFGVLLSFSEMENRDRVVEFRDKPEIEKHTLSNCTPVPVTIFIMERYIELFEATSGKIPTTKWDWEGMDEIVSLIRKQEVSNA